MQALRKRPIRPGNKYDALFPQSIRQDTVIKGPGKAQLHHTLNLIKNLAKETRQDTQLLAQMLKGESLEATCHKIWEFVYDHIQYRRDKAGIEQVRRPSRTWADRRKGVDCDCYTVFISSILTNLDIPHKVRITKYGGKRHFQHIYPIVPRDQEAEGKHGYFTLDCVADHFDYEVPFSDHQDFDMDEHQVVGEVHGLMPGMVSGVDSVDLLLEGLGIFSLKQPSLPLREIIQTGEEPGNTDNVPPSRLTIRPVMPMEETPRLFVHHPVAQAVETPSEKESSIPVQASTGMNKPLMRSTTGWWTKVLIAAGVGYGAYKLLEVGN